MLEKAGIPDVAGRLREGVMLMRGRVTITTGGGFNRWDAFGWS